MAVIAPSLLAADFMNLERDVRRMEKAGAEILHVDVMDGHFVPNLTIGIPVIKALRRVTDLTLDVHLMISNPEQMVESYAQAGADYLSVHFEPVTHLDRLVQHIGELGARPGVVLNPHTPVSALEEILPGCHHVLLMSVNPGFGGQEFVAGSLDKVRKLKSMISARDLKVKIEIDGGVDLDNVRQVVEAGVDIVVAGSAVFHSQDAEETFRRLSRAAQESHAESS